MEEMKFVDLARQPEFFHGVVALENRDGGVLPQRLTGRLRDFYRRQNEMWFARAVSTTGVRLCAEGKNIRRIRMSVRNYLCTRDFFGFDVVDSTGHMQRFTGMNAPAEFHWEAELAPGATGFTIYFPYQQECAVSAFAVNAEAELMPTPPGERRWIFIGDSITQGMEAIAPLETYAAALARRLDCDFYNLSVGGMWMLSEPTAAALDYPWDTAVLAYGVNDAACRVKAADFQAETRRCLELLSSRPGAAVWVVAPLWWPGDPGDSELALFRDILRREAEGFANVHYIDGSELVPHEQKFFADTCHPNAAGMAAMAAGIAARVTAAPTR